MRLRMFFRMRALCLNISPVAWCFSVQSRRMELRVVDDRVPVAIVELHAADVAVLVVDVREGPVVFVVEAQTRTSASRGRRPLRLDGYGFVAGRDVARVLLLEPRDNLALEISQRVGRVVGICGVKVGLACGGRLSNYSGTWTPA